VRRAALAVAFLVAAPAFADFDFAVRQLRRGNLKQAHDEFLAAAKEGHVVAARALGQMLERGHRVEKGERLEAQPAEAARWYRKAAEGGDKISAELLAAMYMGGRGVPYDVDEALRLFEKAGRAPSQSTITALAAYPAGDRSELAAWGMALYVLMARELRYPRNEQRKGFEGRVVILFDAAAGTVEVVQSKTEADEAFRLAALESAATAMRLAPPPESALRHKFRTEAEVAFQLL